MRTSFHASWRYWRTVNHTPIKNFSVVINCGLSAEIFVNLQQWAMCERGLCLDTLDLDQFPDAVLGQAVQVRCLCNLVPANAQRLRAVLVRHHQENVFWLTLWPGTRLGRARDHAEDCCQAKEMVRGGSGRG